MRVYVCTCNSTLTHNPVHTTLERAQSELLAEARRYGAITLYTCSPCGQSMRAQTLRGFLDLRAYEHEVQT